MSSPKVAALYVDPNGVYSGRDDVDLWDETRDARLYDGPWPVVAHPPCPRWSMLAYLTRALHGYEIGDDGGCFGAALEAVATWGGVLEHPAGSLAWPRYGLPKPIRGAWSQSLLWTDGWATEVSQSAYGHRARKRTWLFTMGCELPDLNWMSPPVEAKVSSFNHHPKGGFVPNEAIRVRPAEAAATPPAFAEVLLDMARSCAREALAGDAE